MTLAEAPAAPLFQPALVAPGAARLPHPRLPLAALQVTSGAVAFGKQILTSQANMVQSLEQSFGKKAGGATGGTIDPRACSAAGQGGLIALYDSMFNQYGIQTAQVLVTNRDFQSAATVENLRTTLNQLHAMRVVPIINENDAVSAPAFDGADVAGVISVTDNDSLAASVAVHIGADLLILMTDVDGIYNKAPSEGGQRLEYYTPTTEQIEFGAGSSVGRGGMESKVDAAGWAFRKGVAVMVANGFEDKCLHKLINGENIGTFFTANAPDASSTKEQAQACRTGSRKLQLLEPEQRAEIITTLADMLIARQDAIFAANDKDIEIAAKSNLDKQLLGRLKLTPGKIATLSEGLRQIAEDSKSLLGRKIKATQVADDLSLEQITVPLGVLLVIFESRPDVLPQVAALAIASGNGLLLKGGKEAKHSNKILHSIVEEALELHAPKETVSLVETRDEIAELVKLGKEIDLIIPRGGNSLVQSIQSQAKGIPVMGHADGICHVYVDKDADMEKAVEIVFDSKCDYPSACNAMETLLIHQDLVGTPTCVAARRLPRSPVRVRASRVAQTGGAGHTHARMHARTHARTHAHTHARTHTHTHTHCPMPLPLPLPWPFALALCPSPFHWHLWGGGQAGGTQVARNSPKADWRTTPCCAALWVDPAGVQPVTSSTRPSLPPRACRYDAVIKKLRSADVKINIGPKLNEQLTIGGNPVDSFSIEYGDLECAIEVVGDMEEAIDHIHTHGSSHTEVIITEDGASAKHFLNSVDSACVFHNASSRFADGFRFGLGAEVGISTGRIHAVRGGPKRAPAPKPFCPARRVSSYVSQVLGGRGVTRFHSRCVCVCARCGAVCACAAVFAPQRGPVGVEGLLTTKWRMAGDGHTVEDFATGARTYVHESLPLK